MQALTQNQKDLDSYKDKINFSVKKITEIESNLSEIKNLEPEDEKKYEEIGKIEVISEEKSHSELEHQTEGKDGCSQQVQKFDFGLDFKLRVRFSRARSNNN